MIRVSIAKRPNGTYRARWRETPGAPEKSKAFKHKRDADAFAATIEADSLRGVYVPPDAGRVPLVEAMEQHIERQPWRHNTRRNATYALAHVRRHFGDMPLGAVQASDVQSFVTGLARHLEARTVATVFRFVRQTLRDAHLDGLLGRDPARRVKLPRHDGAELVIPTDDEVLVLHAAAPPEFAVAVVLGAGLGLRPSEAAGLSLDRVDFLRREVTIDRQWHGKLDRFEPVKYAASNRTVPAAPEVLDQLAHHVAAHGSGDHGVLLHADGQPLNSNRMSWRWERTAAAADSEHTMHALRHHYASSLLSAGCSIVAVQRALGHARPSITLDTYGHLMPSDVDRIRGASGRVWTTTADSVRTADRE
jgi:integrase